MKTLSSINARFHNPRLSSVERGQRDIFLQFLRQRQWLRGSSALSISCGDGIWDWLLLRADVGISRVVATDIVPCPVGEPDQLLLRTLGEWEFVRVMPDHPLPFPDETFDLIFHQDVIEHTTQPYFFLREQCRVLKKGGLIIVGTPNLLRPANILRAIVGKLQFPMKIGHNVQIGDYVHVQELHEAQLRLMLTETGFSSVICQPVYFGPSLLNITLSMFPQRGAARAFAHFLMAAAQKP